MDETNNETNNQDNQQNNSDANENSGNLQTMEELKKELETTKTQLEKVTRERDEANEMNLTMQHNSNENKKDEFDEYFGGMI